MPTRDAFDNSDSQTVVLPLRSAAYPVISVGVGIPRRDLAFELRWDIGIRDGMGVSFIGRMAMMTIGVTSDSLTQDSQSEMLRFGSSYALRMPVYPIDAPTPVSRNDGLECVGNDPFGDIQFISQGWLDMSATSPLWTHWNSYSLSSERLLLGAYRPPDGWRANEVHVERADYFNVTVRARHPRWQGILPHSERTLNQTFRLRFDLSCDYSYVPLGALSVFFSAPNGTTEQTTTTTALMLTRALSMLNAINKASLSVCFGRSTASTQQRRHSHDHHSSVSQQQQQQQQSAYCFDMTALSYERMALRVNRASNVDIVLGRRHARHFIVGRDMVRNATSALLLDSLMPHIAEQDYFWLGAVALVVAALWYFGIYVGAYRERLASELFAQLGRSTTTTTTTTAVGDDTSQQRYVAAYGDQRSLFYFYNQRLMGALVNHTRVVLLMALLIVLFGFRLDNAIYLDLPRPYVRTLVAVLCALCTLQLAHITGRTPSQTVRLSLSMSNAALLVIWLVFSVRAHRFINALVMVGASYMLTLRVGQTLLERIAQWLALWHSSPSPLVSLRRWLKHGRSTPHQQRHSSWALISLVVMTIEAVVSWLVVAWLFNGFSVPFLVDIWLSTAPFKLEILLVSALFITFFAPIYLYSRAIIIQVSEANHLVAHLYRRKVHELRTAMQASSSSTTTSSTKRPSPSLPTPPPFILASASTTTTTNTIVQRSAPTTTTTLPTRRAAMLV